MKLNKINGRKLRYGGTSLVLTALIIAVVVMVNVIFTALAEKNMLKLDLTPTELYSLSERDAFVKGACFATKFLLEALSS